MFRCLKKYWFIAGLTAVFLGVMADTSGTATSFGKWFESHSGANAVIFVIFLGSGLVLDVRRLRSGPGDLKGLLTALFLIFVCAPALAFLLGRAPIDHGIVIGFFIMSVAPSTLSSGVVMTAAARGNMAHALLVSLISNALCVITVPLTLPLLLGAWAEHTPVSIDRWALIMKIAALVLLPLVCGMALKKATGFRPNRPATVIQILNQLLILLMVFASLSQARNVLVSGGAQIFGIVFLVAAFHVLMLLAATGLAHLLRLPAPVQKSVLFMGSQKTLPLTLMLQVSAFSGYPLAMVVCVLHHLTQLFIDGYLVGKLSQRSANKQIDTGPLRKLF